MNRNDQEIDIDSLIKRFVRSGMIYVDVGAAHGKYIPAAIECGATVVAVEPGFPNVQVLRQKFEEIEILNCGISDHHHYRRWLPIDETGNGGITDDPGQCVELFTLDELFLNRPFHFLKVDIEGMEFELFKGGLLTLWRYKPVIVFENRYGYQDVRGYDFPLFRVIGSMLSALGYMLMSYRDGKLSAWRHSGGSA
jgi:FkbM family methyltransferase